jgi:hypothetical protein
VTIEKGILTIYGCDNEDMVNAEIKSTIHSNFGNWVNIPCIKDVVVSHEWLKRNGMWTEYYKVPREVIVIWE